MSTGEFDKSKDRLLWEADEVFVDDFTRLSISIFAYGDTGKPKLQISRERKERGQGWTFTKVGRMTLPEFTAVAKAAKIGFAEAENPQREQERAPEGW